MGRYSTRSGAQGKRPEPTTCPGYRQVQVAVDQVLSGGHRQSAILFQVDPHGRQLLAP
jgi:hypothetical protein